MNDEVKGNFLLKHIYSGVCSPTDISPSHLNLIDWQVCKIVQGQRYSKRLNERQITSLLQVTCQRPIEREKDIVQVYLL